MLLLGHCHSEQQGDIISEHTNDYNLEAGPITATELTYLPADTEFGIERARRLRG